MQTLTCDLCGTAYNDVNVEYAFEIQEFLKIDFIGGYASVFGDGKRVKVDICQHCLLGIVKQFVPEGSPLKTYLLDNNSHQYFSTDYPDYTDEEEEGGFNGGL